MNNPRLINGINGLTWDTYLISNIGLCGTTNKRRVIESWKRRNKYRTNSYVIDIEHLADRPIVRQFKRIFVIIDLKTKNPFLSTSVSRCLFVYLFHCYSWFTNQNGLSFGSFGSFGYGDNTAKTIETHKTTQKVSKVFWIFWWFSLFTDISLVTFNLTIKKKKVYRCHRCHQFALYIRN